VATLRISGADARERHRGVSHHSLTAYGRVALAAADVVVPDLSQPDTLAGLPDPGPLLELGRMVDRQVSDLVAPLGRHRQARVTLAGLVTALRECPVGLSTMGRGLDADPAAFLAAAAAGRHARSLVSRQH